MMKKIIMLTLVLGLIDQEITSQGWTTNIQAQMLCKALHVKRIRYQPDFYKSKFNSYNTHKKNW